MVTTDFDHELSIQLKEAGRLLSSPLDSLKDLLHVLDQLEKLLTMVEQTPEILLKEALKSPIKALVDGNLLGHSNMDVKVSVASCICEVTRITAPDAPYSDEELKRVFQCIVSSLEDLSDISSPYYVKRVSIVETVAKVRSCVIMLDLELDDLIVKLFEHFLNSVRDHHVGNVFSLMKNIMVLVLEESEDISLDLLKPLLASVKNRSEGVLPVARRLGEEVIKKSAYKLRPYINKAVSSLGNSLVDYSQVLTSICEGTTDFVEHNDESASVQPKVVDPAPGIVLLDDAAKVINNGESVTEHEGDVNDNPSKKPEGAGEDLGTNLTSKLVTNGSVTENSRNVEANPDTTESAKPFVSETVHGENRAEKSPKVVVALKKPLESEVANAPSQSGSQQEESQSKIQIKKGFRSKKKGPGQTDPPVALLGLVVESMSDPEMRSPKRARKKTQKAEDYKPSVTTGTSDVEPLKNLDKKVETSDSAPKPKPAKRSGKKTGGNSVAKKPKLSGKKVLESKKSKQDDKKAVEVGDSESKSAKQPLKKGNETDSDAKPLKQSGKKGQKSKVITKPSEDSKDEETDSDPIQLKQSGKKGQKSKVITKPSEDSKDEETDSDPIPLKQSGKKVKKSKVITKPSEVSSKDGETQSDPEPLKQSGKKGKRSKVITKPSEVSSKDEETQSDPEPLKQSGKKGKRSKVITKPTEDACKDDETDSDNTPLKLPENKEEKTDSDRRRHNLSESKDDEETDSDNIPLMLSAKRVKKSSSSVVKSSVNNKDGKKQERGEHVEDKDQTKSLSEDDDGMNVSLKSALKKVTKRKGNSEEALSTSSKRKRPVTKKKVTGKIKFDDSLVGQKVKVWWALDKMYYEGVVESFDSAAKRHKILYMDGDEETLNLRTEKWEILKESSSPINEVAVEAQNTDVLPDIAGSSKGESKDTSKIGEEMEEDDKEETPKKIVYSRGRKGGSKRKNKSSDDKVKETEAVDAAERPESEKDPQIGSKTGNKKSRKN